MAEKVISKPASETGQKPVFVIDKMATRLFADPASLRESFERNHMLFFEQPFSPAILDMLMHRAASANFTANHVRNIGDREIEQVQSVGSTLNLLLARPVFCTWLEQATGLAPLKKTEGRLAQTRANAGHDLDWHDDIEDDKRLLAVVINLSDQPFRGGEFLLRRKGETEPFHTHNYTQPGSMMIFAVRQDLEHCVTEVISGGPRRVFAGWFMRDAKPMSGRAET